MADNPGNKPTGGNGKKESLEDLLGTLSAQIKSSDWLQKNTPEKFEAENPEVAKAFKEAREQAQKPKDNQS